MVPLLAFKMHFMFKNVWFLKSIGIFILFIG